MRAENKVFFAYVIPSVLAFALSGVYTVVDGFFIGRSMGDAGLAAIAVGFPIAAFIQAVGTGIGLAGAIRFTILAAQNKERQKRECFTETVLLMLFASFLLTVIFYFATERILLLFGAKGKIQTLSAEYVRVIVLGSVFQLTATGTVPFIRNMNGAAFAMFSMILGFLANIVLDYALVWVFPFGMAGAAAATVIGQAITLLCAAAFFVKKKCRPRFSRAAEMFTLWGQVLKVSVSPFGLNFSPQLTLLFMNRFLLTYGNAQSVAVFGCIGYVLSVIYFLIQGVGDGSQPLISDRYGRKDVAGVRAVRTKAYLFAAALTAVCMTVMFLTREKNGRSVRCVGGRQRGNRPLSAVVFGDFAFFVLYPYHDDIFLRRGKRHSFLHSCLRRTALHAASSLPASAAVKPDGRVAGRAADSTCRFRSGADGQTPRGQIG